MDNDQVPDPLVSTGRQYIEALIKLGFVVMGAAWAREHIELGRGAYRLGDWRLVLISPLIDEGGPLALNRLLFAAHDKAATPAEISPFSVEVISAKTELAASILQSLASVPDVSFEIVGRDGSKQSVGPAGSRSLVGDLWFAQDWAYRFRVSRQPKHAERKRAWRNFYQKVNGLAA